MQTIVDDYHNTLKELVGEGGYEEFLNSLHFVFTHNDETYDGETYTSEQISMRCEELTFCLFAKEVKNLFLPQFVMRMGEAHTLVDYSTQTSEELRQSIESSSAVPADAVMTVNDMKHQCDRLLAAEQQMVEQATAFALDALKGKSTEAHGALQTRVLEATLILGQLQVADAILGQEIFQHYDKRHIAGLCEQHGLVERARSLYTDIPVALFKLFIRCYNEFDAKFDAVKATNSLICFGVSGAGKSAFLARLLSSLDPSGFKAALPEDSIVSIEGVNVGGTISSTTLVPVMYDVGGGQLQIFDVPGFKDTNEERQVVINILHKCLLTRVKVRPRVLRALAPSGRRNG